MKQWPAGTLVLVASSNDALLRNALTGEVGTPLDEAFAFDGARCDRIVRRVLGRIRALG
jgi:hypothetical protein